MKIARIPLQPYSRFHFGELKLEENLALSSTSFYAHSDTLFSALVNGFSKMEGDAESFVKRFAEGSIKISSLFYYLRSNGHNVFFLPKPGFLAIHSPKSKDGLHKKRNRIKFVSKGVWDMGFQAEKWFDKNNSEFKVIQEEFVMTREEFNSIGNLEKIHIAKKVLNPKSPKRAHNNAAIFYQTDVEIGGSELLEVGWYFMYEAEGKAETELMTATNIIAYTGIGGEIHNTGRTIKSTPEFDNIPNFEAKTDSKWTNLSLLNPKEGEFANVKYYQTEMRGGRFIPNNGNAKVVKMILEGALIEDENIEGQLVNLGNDENDKIIFRNGIALLIPVKDGN